MNLLLVSPLLIPLITAAVSLLAWQKRITQRWLAVIGTALLFVATAALLWVVQTRGIQSIQVGDWPFPLGITLVADLFSAIMLVVAGTLALTVAVYSLASMDHPRESFGYYPLYHLQLMGVCGAFLTGDIFNLFVWFEVMLMASFALLALGGERAQLEGAIKYVSINVLSSALFLSGVGLLYGLAGTLNMADLAYKLHQEPPTQPGLLTAVAVLFLISFGIKSALFPLFFWLPASYHRPPVAVSAIFAGLLTKVGVYALIRVFTLLFTQEPALTHTIILVLSGLTMLTGVLGAAAQNEFRRLLSFHIISHIAYMTIGLGRAGQAQPYPEIAVYALAGSLFYIVHHIFVKTNLFLVSGIAYRLQGSYDLKTIGGLYHSRPMLSLLFLIPAFSLAGMPPLSGFFAKLALVQAGLRSQQYLIVGVALLVGLLTLYSMTKVWLLAFWKPAPETSPSAGTAQNSQSSGGGMWGYFVPVTVLATITMFLGLAAGPCFDLAKGAAEQMLNRAEYIEAVGGRQP